MPQPRYSDDQKGMALAIYREHGPREAGRRTGIPVRTISRWAAEHGVSTEVVTRTRAATEAAAVSLAKRKQELAERLMDDALRLRRQLWEQAKVHDFTKDGAFVTGELDEPTFADKRNLMTSIAVAVDKIQLLTGAATSRNVAEERELDAQIQRYLAEFDGVEHASG